MAWFMGNTSFAHTLPELEEYNHNEVSSTQLAEEGGRRAEREFIVSLIRQTYTKPTQQMLNLLARLETDGGESEQHS